MEEENNKNNEPNVKNIKNDVKGLNVYKRRTKYLIITFIILLIINISVFILMFNINIDL